MITGADAPQAAEAAPPATTAGVLARIRAFKRMKGWAPSRLAREAGLSNMALRDIDSAEWSPTVDTLRKIEALIEREAPGWDAALSPAAGEAAE